MLSVPAMISSYILRNNQIGKLKGLQEDFPFGLQRNFPSQFFYFYPFMFCQNLPRHEKLLPLDPDY